MSKIFLGTTDIAGQLSDFKNGYERLGHKTFVFVYDKREHFNESKYSVALHNLFPKFLYKYKLLKKVFTLLFLIPVKYAVFLWAAVSCDVFHFMWFLEKENRLYFRLLKLLNKKIIVSFVGSDIRWIPLWIQEFRQRGISLPDESLLMENTIRQKSRIGEKLRYVRTCEKYADLILSIPEQGQLQLRPYFNFLLPVDFNNIQFRPPVNYKPVVAIGVTEPNFKNSASTINMVNEFRASSNLDFELIIIQNKTHAEALELLSKSDIFVYSPYVSGPGKFGIEALAAGAVLLTGYEDAFYNMAEHPPLVKVTPENFIEKLSYFLSHTEERNELAVRGRAWVEKFANIDWICSDILAKLSDKNIPPEYYPSFFRDHARFTSRWDEKEACEICNRWTGYVSRCAWYKPNIKPGLRDGLIF
jgi:glycosyltransferase involved in cell wall biosynthesis